MANILQSLGDAMERQQQRRHENNMEAVSYTHLDVYKRQERRGAHLLPRALLRAAGRICAHRAPRMLSLIHIFSS